MGPNFEIAEKVEKMEINKGKERERNIRMPKQRIQNEKEHIVYRKNSQQERKMNTRKETQERGTE